MGKLFFTISFLMISIHIHAKIIIPKDAKHKVHYVKAVKATPETLRGYGTVVPLADFDSYKVKIVTWPAQGWRPVVPGTGNEGGIVEGKFSMFWKGNRLYAINKAVGRKYLIGWATYPTQASHLPTVKQEDRNYALTFEANYHPDGEQLFMPQQRRPFVALLALPGDDIAPDDFVAFYCDGSFGVAIGTGVWHQPLFSVKNSIDFQDRQGKVHACIAINFPEEFGCYIAVPLYNPEKNKENKK
jgi:ureidoglycolate lyase